MNLVIDNTVEVNGNEKNDIGMVVSVFLLFLSLLTCEASIWGDFPVKDFLIDRYQILLQVIRGNSVVTVEALEPVSKSQWRGLPLGSM